MDQPLALILGGRRGMAGALSRRLQTHYSVAHVSRSSSSDMAGDLRSSEFRKKIVEHFAPQLLVSSFGNWDDTRSLISALDTFLLPNVDLFERFEGKGCLKKFVLISSAAARFSTLPRSSREELNYNCSKRAVSDIFQQLPLWGRSRSKMLIFEPGFVATDFAEINQRMRSKSDQDILHLAQIKPKSPEDIAETVFQLIMNPTLGDVALTTFNHLGDDLRS